jgi:hypothetical protein
VTASFELWFAVRFAHVASVTLLIGGAAILCAWCLVLAPAEEPRVVLRVATLYEWAFWSIVGVTVLTGVSNLGLKGDGLMAAPSGWGRALTFKLAAALVLLMLSLIRSDVVIRTADPQPEPSVRVRGVLGWMYGATLGILLGVLWLGLGLAHGRY